MTTVLIDGHQVDFGAAVNLMDDELREALHAGGDFATEQEFADAYCAAHRDKYGEEFTAN